MGLAMLPPSKTLPMKIEAGAPTLVHIEHEGQKYLLRINATVMAVWPLGGPPDLNGMPQFNVQIAPVMMVTKDDT